MHTWQRRCYPQGNIFIQTLMLLHTDGTSHSFTNCERDGPAFTIWFGSIFFVLIEMEIWWDTQSCSLLPQFLFFYSSLYLSWSLILLRCPHNCTCMHHCFFLLCSLSLHTKLHNHKEVKACCFFCVYIALLSCCLYSLYISTSYILLFISYVSNSRPAGQIRPATSFYVATRELKMYTIVLK